MTLATLLSLGACAAAAPSGTVPAPSTAAVEARIDSIFAHFGPATPGCAVGVFRAGEVVFAKGYGMADLEHGVPITPETVFDIASNSKQFTAFAVHLLARQAKLSLDDDVRKYIPELPDLGSVTTLRHLMNNTSGMREYGDLRPLADPRWTHEHPFSRPEVMELLARQRTVSFPSGERYLYTNTNWLLLAMVVERVDGRAFRDFMEQEVFQPLGMTSTLVRDDPMRVVQARATNYMPLEDGGYRINLTWLLASDLGGAGIVNSTLADLARWDANFYDERVGGTGITEAMYTRGVLSSGDTISYATGLSVGQHRGLPAIWHGGMAAGTSQLIRYPEQRLSVAVLCNQYYTHTPADGYAKRVAAMLLPPARVAAPAVVLDSAALARFAGRFIDLESGWISEYSVHEGVLVEKDGATTWPMVALGDGRFEDDDVRLEFAADGSEAHAVNKQTLWRGRLLRADGDLWKPAVGDLTSYRGHYASDELEVSWEIVIVDDVVTLRRRGAPDTALEPRLPDRFRTSDRRTITFVRDAGGAVTGLSVNTPRALNVEFTRIP